jgi:hypothetical protein
LFTLNPTLGGVRVRHVEKVFSKLVRNWDLADIPAVAAYVRFRGKSGHGFRTAKCPLMTRNGHEASGWMSASKAAGCLAEEIWEAVSWVVAAVPPGFRARLRAQLPVARTPMTWPLQ